jgi:hypothetical protein
MLLYLYLITLCKKHVHCDIISTKLQVKFNSLSLSFIDNTKTRISNIVVVYIDAVSIHSFIYIFSKMSYKKKVHLQMSIRICYGTVVNNYPFDFILITFICCAEWLFFQSVPVSGCWKLSDFFAITAVTWSSIL